MKDGKRELIIGRETRGYVALYSYLAAIDTVFVLAVRARREDGFSADPQCLFNQPRSGNSAGLIAFFCWASKRRMNAAFMKSNPPTKTGRWHCAFAQLCWIP
jgi:hypothetical protein